jgi:outer membrane murein-binding lipoprotein Lpp
MELVTRNDLEEILGRALKEALQPIHSTLSELKTDVAELKADVAELKADVAILKTDVAELKTDVAILKTDVAILKTDVGYLKGVHRVNTIKDRNARLRHRQPIAVVPRINTRGELEYPEQDMYPRNLGELFVAGNETNPIDGNSCEWNSAKSRRLINFYEPEYESDGEEGLVTSKKRRAKVAECLGITPFYMHTLQTLFD